MSNLYMVNRETGEFVLVDMGGGSGGSGDSGSGDSGNSQINAPVILSPAANAQIGKDGDIVIITDAFVTNGDTADTHASTDWKITSDAAGQTVVAEALESPDLLQHTFSELDLTAGQSYYAWARHRGAVLGAGPWNSGRKFTAIEGITAPSGRLLYRHESGMGTVMEYNDGTLKRVLVLDAEYRTSAKFGTSAKDSPLANFATKNNSGNNYINGTVSATTPENLKGMTDATLNAMWPSLDQNTAKANCDVWMTYEGTTDNQSISGVPAVRAARAVLVDGVGCDLPNFQQGMRIYCDAEALDDLDPTVASYPANALGSANTNGHWRIAGHAFACTSVEYSSVDVWSLGSIGYFFNADKSISYAVLPILEI